MNSTVSFPVCCNTEFSCRTSMLCGADFAFGEITPPAAIHLCPHKNGNL